MVQAHHPQDQLAGILSNRLVGQALPITQLLQVHLYTEDLRRQMTKVVVLLVNYVFPSITKRQVMQNGRLF